MAIYKKSLSCSKYVVPKIMPQHHLMGNLIENLKKLLKCQKKSKLWYETKIKGWRVHISRYFTVYWEKDSSSDIFLSVILGIPQSYSFIVRS